MEDAPLALSVLRVWRVAWVRLLLVLTFDLIAYDRPTHSPDQGRSGAPVAFADLVTNHTSDHAADQSTTAAAARAAFVAARTIPRKILLDAQDLSVLNVGAVVVIRVVTRLGSVVRAAAQGQAGDGDQRQSEGTKQGMHGEPHQKLLCPVNAPVALPVVAVERALTFNYKAKASSPGCAQAAANSSRRRSLSLIARNQAAARAWVSSP